MFGGVLMNTEDVNCKLTKRQFSEEQTKTYKANVADGGEDDEINWKAMTIKLITCTIVWSITKKKQQKKLTETKWEDVKWRYLYTNCKYDYNSINDDNNFFKC